MLCEVCNKNEATIHVQELINHKLKTLHICQDCAVQKSKEGFMQSGINIAEILYNLTANASKLNKNSFGAYKSKQSEKVLSIVCPDCKWDLERFKKTGRLGCSNCYKVFSDVLAETFRNIHRGLVHVGKRPYVKTSGYDFIKVDIIKLQKKLEGCIKKEEYEKAANLRDQINALKKQAKENGNS